MRNRLLEAFFIRATIGTVTILGRFRYFRLHAPQFVGIDWIPGQQLRVDCGPDDGLMPLLRTYSVWNHDDDWIDLYCLVHGDGPGSIWAAHATAGQSVLVTKPKGDFVTRPGGYHLFVGDETASAAFGPMIRHLPDDLPVYTVVEIGDDADRLPLTRDATWVHRTSGPASAADNGGVLVAAVSRLTLPDQPGVGYLAGEARTIQAVRSLLIHGRGWTRRSIHTKPFWTPGKRGLE
jgi:NADPH-dependent ferric siderophore reductase